MEEAKKFIEELDNKRKEVLSHFDEWRELYPDFKRISEIMENFKTNDLLVEYQKNSLPTFIGDKAIEIYKKCLSFKVKLKMYKIDKLGYSYTPMPYCINSEKVKLFVDEYQTWGRKSYEIWHDVYYLKEDFFNKLDFSNDKEKLQEKFNNLLSSSIINYEQNSTDINFFKLQNKNITSLNDIIKINKK